MWEGLRPAVDGFEDIERGPQAKKCWWPLEAGKGKVTDSPEELSPADTLIFRIALLPEIR